MLYDLTTLQREAAQFKLTPSKTFRILQELHQYHKLITCPQTKTRFVPLSTHTHIKMLLKYSFHHLVLFQEKKND
jgi:DNA topoisomerase IA